MAEVNDYCIHQLHGMGKATNVFAVSQPPRTILEKSHRTGWKRLVIN